MLNRTESTGPATMGAAMLNLKALFLLSITT
jgi:hypothetical protein